MGNRLLANCEADEGARLSSRGAGARFSGVLQDRMPARAAAAPARDPREA